MSQPPSRPPGTPPRPPGTPHGLPPLRGWGRASPVPAQFRPASPYCPSPPPLRLPPSPATFHPTYGSIPGSPAPMFGCPSPRPYIPCPRPRWPVSASPVPMNMGPRPYRIPLQAPSPVMCASPAEFYYNPPSMQQQHNEHPQYLQRDRAEYELHQLQRERAEYEHQLQRDRAGYEQQLQRDRVEYERDRAEYERDRAEYQQAQTRGEPTGYGICLEPQPLTMHPPAELLGFYPPGYGPDTADIIASQSQDYVDEKLAEYQATIHQLQDEQERVQKKTFVNWINSYLSKRVPPLRVDNLIEDLKDGTKLLALLEVLSGEKLPLERGRNLKRPHFLSNANTALTFLQSKKIKLVNINSSDLVDGRPPVVLGLIWTIILYFQIEENTRVLESLGHTFGGSASSLESLRQDGASSPESRAHRKAVGQTERMKSGAKRAMLNWVQAAMPPSVGVEVRDFGPSWRDGRAFLGIIEAIKANLLDLTALRQSSNRVRLETAFHVAESELGIARLLDAEDVDVERPDEKSIMTYVAQFLHKYPEPASGANTLSEIQEEYTNLIEWLSKKTQYLEHLQQTQSLPLNYSDYITFKNEVDSKSSVYEKLKKLVDNQSMVAITLESWRVVEKLWSKLESQMLFWLWLLDARLPGDLGQVGEWLHQAEALILADDIPQLMNEETAGIISRKLEEHKSFFADLPAVQSKFESARRGPATQGVNPAQLDNMALRLGAIGPKAAQRRIRLKFLEHKCCLIAFLHLTENKLRAWTVKYGREDKVQQLLEQYRNFVSRNRIFQEFNKAYQDMQQVVEEYKTEGKVDQRERTSIDRFMKETGERWKSVSMELRCVQSMLEEVINYWKRWNTASAEFESWLERAYSMMDLPDEERMEFFQDLSVWKERYQTLGDTVTFLIATCDDPIVVELKDRYTRISSRWEELFPHVKQYMHAGDILRNRKDYRAGVEQLQNWLRNAETTLASSQISSTQTIKAYGEKLQKLQHEVEEMEDLFKSISRKFQSLIPDLSREEVDRMMLTLKKEKEALVRVRALVPMQLHLFHQILVQHESLEAGQIEIGQWLDEADNFLATHTITADREQMQAQLDKHKVFFSRTLYYKSMLESKNKVYHSIMKSLMSSEGIDTSGFKMKMEELNERFIRVTHHAQLWEQKLLECLRCWENFRTAEKVITEWLHKAEQLISEKHIDNRQTVEAHKVFFEKTNDKWFPDLINASQDLQNSLPAENQAYVISTVDKLQAKWKEIQSFAPLHLMKLEFRLDETTFNQYLKDVEMEINAEQQAFNRHEDIEGIMARHNEFFVKRNVDELIRSSLETLGRIRVAYAQWQPLDPTLEDAHNVAKKQWEVLRSKVEAFRQQLQEIPAQWNKYHTKFADMVKWMDSVDQSLRNIMREVNTLEEFEKEKVIFQGICHDVDSKREDMKWLVQTLDQLVSNRTDPESSSEQKRLEELIGRYKNLIPTIELTMVKTDIFSKCYTYRKEVREVCSLLQKVKESSAAAVHPDSMELVQQLIKQQETALGQLDEQRPNIMSMLQRGKDLSRDSSAPDFVKSEVTCLESNWNDAYAQTAEKLKKLRGTQKVWNQYREQKDEIVALLEQADAELRKMIPSNDLRQIAADLQTKQNLSVALREATEEMLKKLRDLCAALAAVVPPKKPVLEKEVTEIERRLQVVLETVHERVVYLESFQARWTKFSCQLGELRAWCQTAPTLLDQLAAPDMSPAERVNKAHTLQAQLQDKTRLLNALAAEARELFLDNSDDPEAQRLKSEVLALQEEVQAIQRAVELQCSAVGRDLANWQTYQAGLQQVRPWIEQAEVKVAMGVAKPASLQEATEQLHNAKTFESECETKLAQLQETAAKSQQMTCQTNAHDEVDALHSRWTSVHGQALNWSNRLEQLVASWGEFNQLEKQLADWLQAKEAEVQAPVNLNSPDVAKLEQQLAQLKAIMSEISEKQPLVSTATQMADGVSQGLAMDGATALKSQVVTLKARFANLADATRQKANEISDTILSRQEFQGQMGAFNTWMEKHGDEIGQLDELQVDMVDCGLQTVHALLQEHAERQPLFNVIYSEVKKMASCSSPQEAGTLNQIYSGLSEKFQELEDNLQEKKTALEKWSELLSWHAESSEQLSHMRYQMDSQKPLPEVLERFSQELAMLQTKCAAWKQLAPSIDHSSKQSGTQITDKGKKPVTAQGVVRDVEKLICELQQQIGCKKETIQEVGAHWSNFQEVQQHLSSNLQAMQAKIQQIVSGIDSVDNLDMAVKELSGLLEEQNVKEVQKKRLHEQGKLLMQEDPSNAASIQGILASVDSNWEMVGSLLHENKTKYSDLKTLWHQFADCKNKVQRAIKDAEKIDEEVGEEIPNDQIQATMAHDKVKKALEALKKTKPGLDAMDSKGQLLNKENTAIFANVKKDVADAHQQWQQVNQALARKLQNFETQVIIWRQIDEAKDDLLHWLGEMSDCLSKATGMPSDPDIGVTQLNKYKEELSLHYNLKTSIATKSAQLVKLNDGKCIPTLDSLNQLLEEEFQHVKEIADKLESFACTYNEQEKSMKDEAKKLTDNLNKIREAIIQCDDLSGEHSKILERLQKCQEMSKELVESSSGIAGLKQKITNIKSSYPAFGETGLVKEISNLQKRQEGVTSQANKVEVTLLGFLKKHNSEKLTTLQRIVCALKEKVQWCLPEAGSDKYNLEVKSTSLQDVEMGLSDCATKQNELDHSLSLLEKVETPSRMQELQTERNGVVAELDTLKDSYRQAKEAIEKNIGLWQHYELSSENVSSWLRDTEGKVRTEGVNQVNLITVNDKIKEIEAFQQQVEAYEPELKNLSFLAGEIMKESPESRVGQFVGNLMARYTAVLKFIQGYLEKLEGMKKNQDQYKASVASVQKWLSDADTKLKSFEQLPAMGPKTILVYQSKLKELKSFADARDEGQALMNKAVERGEALFPGITPENRESIRAELRVLRDASEALIDKANAIHKRMEGVIMQRSSFDDSYTQVNQWIAEAQARVGKQVDLKATLQEKKALMHSFKSLAQDIASHKNIMSQLNSKIEVLSDPEANEKFAEIMANYEQLTKDSEQRITVSEKYVVDHEGFLQSIEKMRDFLSTCKAEASVVTEAAIEKEGADSKLAVIDNLLQQKEAGDKLIETCELQLQEVLKQSDTAGHLGLHNEFEEQKRAWRDFLQQCLDIQSKLHQLCSKWSEFESIVDQLSTWMKQKETQVKDQSLRNSLEAKQVHLDKLRSLEDEIWAKSDEFAHALEQSQSIEGETELAAKVSQLSTRYQALKNTTKEVVNRYEQFVKEHNTFNDGHTKFVEWVTMVEEQLKSLSEIVGDFAVLQDRQRKIRHLADVRSAESDKYEALIDLGEKLYTHTSPDGREIIRQQLRTLRTLWDTFSDDLQACSHKLEQCLLQFAEFSQAQEQLTKWLRDVEKAMQQHTELKCSLLEKRAQLQNHKMMHQEIMSHQQLVEAVCDKAQQLVDQTQDKSLNVYLESIKQLFKNIVVKSQDLHDKLDNCVQEHSNFNTQCKNCRDWINAEREKLHECDNIGGEKSDISRRLSTAKLLRQNEAVGQRQLSDLREMCDQVCLNTATKGKEALKKDIDDLEVALQTHLSTIDDIEKNLLSAQKQWQDFECELDSHTKWFRNTEAIFRDQQLQVSLLEKEAQLQSLKDKRTLITDKEQEIDTFIDQSHSLLHCSGVDRIKPLISQISNRYQLLHVLSKEVINRWQGLVDDHRVYDEKFLDTVAWLTPLEEQFESLKKDDNIATKASRLQLLLSERENASHRLASLTAMGERLFPDTAAQGREKIRHDLRALRERWEQLEEGICEQQKRQEAESLQWNSYQEMLQQTLAWLDAMEKSQHEPTTWSSSPQETRSKLLKQKTILQEVLSHKRVIEAVGEKAQALAQASSYGGGDVLGTVEAIGKRYEELVNNYLVAITMLEESLDAFTLFQDLQKAHQDYQKQLWDRLSVYSDYSGNKPALMARLAKISEIQDSLGEGSASLKSLADHVANKSEKLPPRAKEAMERDLSNLKFDFEKLVTSLGDVKHGLEERLQQWSEYEGSFERLLSWLADTEASLKNYTHRNNLEEKEEQLEKYQSMILSLKQNEADFDKMSDESSDLVQISGETRISVNVQQITSRFQSIQSTAKEILKKCEQAVTDHQAYLEKFKQASAWLANAQSRYAKCCDARGSRQEVEGQQVVLRELLGEQGTAAQLVNTTVELGEKLYPSTAADGREAVRMQLEELQQALEALLDDVSATDKKLHDKISRWAGYEEQSEQLRRWLKETESQLPDELHLWTTLDEKRAQLLVYRTALQDVSAHQQDIVALKDKAEALPERGTKVDQLLSQLTTQHATLLKRAQSFVERYEAIVSDHQQYSKAVMDNQEWLEATHNTVLLWGDCDLERISLHSNIERLKNLQTSLPEEEHRIHVIRSLGQKVIPGTVDSGQINIRSQIDYSQQEWEGLLSAVQSTIESLELKLVQWNEYETLKDQCMAWIRQTDTRLHAVDLKATLPQKVTQLEALKSLQGEVRAKELEMDAVTERAQQLYKGSMSARSSQISELGLKYQQVSHKAKDLTSRWHQYVTSHQDFDTQNAECLGWLDNIRKKLQYCSDVSAQSQKDLETKLETIQGLLLDKEEGFAKVQNTVELAQNVLANTAPSGHEPINQALAKLQEEWSSLASRMIEIKNILDDSIHKWSGFLEQIQQLDKVLEPIESSFSELSEYQTTLSEKKAQLERLKALEEKVRCEKIEVDSHRTKAREMLQSGQQSHAATQAQAILNKFDALAEKVKKLLVEREEQFKDHRLYKEAHDDLIGWLSRAREKVPSMRQRPLSDKLAIENAVAPLESLLNKQAQGELLVEHLQHTGEVVLASTSSQGCDIIRNEIKALRESFEAHFKEIKQQKEQLEGTVVAWREYKDEYERLSDWLQQLDILIKAHKTALLSTVQEKSKQVQEVKEILDKLEKGQVQIDKFNQTASVLLSSHLDSYVQSQLRHLNSRYQVQVNIAKDVMKKVETNLEQHQQYETNYAKALSWVESAKQVIWDSSSGSATSSREILQARLDQVQELLRSRDIGQNLVHVTVSWGEKTLRNTRSDGRDVINTQLRELQADWERLVRKISTSKVHLETSLLQWADYSSSYSNLQQWISDREAKLQQVCEQKISKARKQVAGLSSLSIGERKATLRQTNSIVQDIVSFEPMIQSVASKASDLQQPAAEISTKYESLSKQAKELYAKQKETVEQHQAFIDAGNDFVQWIRAAKEKLSKCSEPTGDKESLSSKVTQLKVLQSEQSEGQKKLEKALEQGDVACQVADSEDKEVIEEEVALLQEEFDTYVDSLTRTKQLLEEGIVKWTEYEDQYQEASDWLTQTEGHVQSFNKLSNTLEEKKTVLEQFQVHLQTVFDWQKELDRLNMKAQVLLETCADSRISNAVTQMTTKYNALLSLAKEVMRRLELHYQEHQQHYTLYQELEDWVDRTKEKVRECEQVPSTLNEVNNKLQTVKGIRQSLEQGQNKLRYALELKEKVILNTEQSGAAKIQEDTENLKTEFERLMSTVQDLRQKLTTRAAQLEDAGKGLKVLVDWLDEVERKMVQVQNAAPLSDISEKRAMLEKVRGLQRDVSSHAELVERTQAKLNEDPSLPRSSYEDSVKRFNTLKDLLDTTVANLEEHVSKYENYKQAYNAAFDWVRKTRIEIQQCSDSHGEKDQTVAKEEKVSKIAATLPEGEALVQRAIELSTEVMEGSSSEGQDTTKQEIAQLQADWEGLKLICKDTHKVLTKCISAWNDFSTSYDTMKNWLDDFQARVEAETESEKRTPEDLQKCRALLQEANQHKVVMEELNDRCELLMELSACGWVRDHTVTLQGAYSNLFTSAQGLVSKVQKNLSDHTEFINAKEELDSWLKRAHGTVQTCMGVGDEDVTKDKLDTIKLVSSRMTEGQHMMSGMQEVFTKALNNTPEEQQGTLREDMQLLHQSWEQLSIDLNSVMAQLKAASSRWEDFNESKAKLIVWIGNMEEMLQETPDTKAELGEMKTLIERYKHLQEEVQGRRTDLDHLLTEAAELSVWAGQPLVLDEMQNVQTRFDHLSVKSAARKTSLEGEMQDYTAYHQSLQDTEKWLLQISFQLMAHNSLYITNRQQTQEQISEHEALLDDIQKFQGTLDDVKAKGHGQIERYIVTTPSIQDTIERQLHNVQDSYNSLLHTAIQIKNRLLDSLAKFQEYENTLESIMANLDTYEPVIASELEAPSGNLKEAQHQMERVRGLHNKLQAEKQRLAVAVQACEAAAACISRPSSPQDTMPTPVPDRELMVRARLEDLIDQSMLTSQVDDDKQYIRLLLANLQSQGILTKLCAMCEQVQSRLSGLTATVGELEEWSRQTGAVQQWVGEQRTQVAEMRSRPAKLRPEAARQELAHAQELLVRADEQRQRLHELANSCGENPEIETSIDALESEVQQLIAKRQASQDIIDDYRNSLQELQGWLTQLMKNMEVLDKGSGLECVQKLARLGEISQECECGGARLEQLKQKAAAVMDEVSNLETQQVEEQLKAVDRRHTDMHKRLQRKAQVLEMTKKGVDTALQEIEQARAWAKDKMAEVEKPKPVGCDSKSAEEKLQSLKSLLKEAEGKEVLLETLEKRVGAMQPELEPSEYSALEAALQALAALYDDLRAGLRREMTRVTGCVDSRRRFEADLEQALAWIKTKGNDIKSGGWAPLHSSTVDTDIHQYKNLDASAKDYNDTTMADLHKQANNLMKDGGDDDKIKLKAVMQDADERMESLRGQLGARISSLNELLQSRKQLEEQIASCEHWLNQAEVATSADMRTTNISLLEELLAKYSQLEQECVGVGGQLEQLVVQGKTVLPSVSESDRVLLSEQLSGLKEKHARISATISERLAALRSNMEQCQAATTKLQETLNFMNDIQQEIKELNKPVGSKVEDVQGMLVSYEKILNDLKVNRERLGELDPSNAAGLQTTLQQQDDLIRTIEGQIARLRQLLLLREQFISLVTEIMTFITKYTGVVRDIERGGHTVNEKIKKYDDVIVKIQECEAMLASATDKGQLIAGEGSAADRNSVTEQLQSLKQQLQGLRRAVESQRSQHELTAAEHQKVAAELATALDWLHQREAAVRSRPLLERDPTSVESEIAKHKVLANDVEAQLELLRGAQASLRHDEGLPASLQEQLSEASMLLELLPRELAERSKYLESNKVYRLEHQALKKQLHDWVCDAESKMNIGHEGVDFENVVANLEEHKREAQQFWSLVEFYPDEEDETHPVCAVPSNWIRVVDNVQICLYPSKRTKPDATSKLIRKGAIPEEQPKIQWEQYRINRILNRNPINTYLEAKNLEEQSLKNSDVEDLRDESLSKKHRAERHKKSMESSSDEGSEVEANAYNTLIPPPPELQTGHGNTVASAANHQQQQTAAIPLPLALCQPPDKGLPTPQDLLLLSPPTRRPTAPLNNTALTASLPRPPPPPAVSPHPQTHFQQTPPLPSTPSVPFSYPPPLPLHQTFTPSTIAPPPPPPPPPPPLHETASVIHPPSPSTPTPSEPSNQPQHQKALLQTLSSSVTPQTDAYLISSDDEYGVSNENGTPVTRRGFGKRTSNNDVQCCCGKRSCERNQYFNSISDAVFSTHYMVNEQYRAKKRKQTSELSSFLATLKFPISTVEEFEQLNHEIENNRDSKLDLIRKLGAHCAGASVQACVYQALKWLVANHVANTYNWNNRHNNELKHPMAGMPFINAVFEAVHQKEGMTNCNVPEVEKHIKNWFRQAVNRIPELRTRKSMAGNTTGMSEKRNHQSWASATTRTPPARRNTSTAQSQDSSPYEPLQNATNQALPPTSHNNHNANHSWQRTPPTRMRQPGDLHMSTSSRNSHIHNGNGQHQQHNSSTHRMQYSGETNSSPPLDLHVRTNPYHSALNGEWHNN